MLDELLNVATLGEGRHGGHGMLAATMVGALLYLAST
jgi:hypothetical protein